MLTVLRSSAMGRRKKGGKGNGVGGASKPRKPARRATKKVQQASGVARSGERGCTEKKQWLTPPHARGRNAAAAKPGGKSQAKPAGKKKNNPGDAGNEASVKPLVIPCGGMTFNPPKGEREGGQP